MSKIIETFYSTNKYSYEINKKYWVTEFNPDNYKRPIKLLYDLIDSDSGKKILSKGEKLSKDPRIEVSTIHAAKGGECDNVVVVLDNSKKIRESVEVNADKANEEHRVWYVGITRTKQNLYLLKPKKERYGYSL